MNPSQRIEPDPRGVSREIVTTWAICFLGIGLAKLISLVEPTGLLSANLAGVAAVLFVVLPERRIHARGERWSAYGMPWWGLLSRRTWESWLGGLVAALAVCGVVFPLFFVIFFAYARMLPHLPVWLATHVAPYALPHRAHVKLPPQFALRCVVQLLAVALPEELFYRGFMQTRWAASDPGRKVRVLGASLGRGFLQTQLLFAAGHLVVLQVWRLATFFPGLLFGWLRERTGNLAAPVIVHALSNLFIATLEATFYG